MSSGRRTMRISRPTFSGVAGTGFSNWMCVSPEYQPCSSTRAAWVSEIVARTRARLNANPFWKGRTVNDERIAALARSHYLDVEPWPFAALEPYAAVARPQRGDRWRGNLYKCADHTSHPHWLTWAPINRPRPDFHVPDQFGILTFG